MEVGKGSLIIWHRGVWEQGLTAESMMKSTLLAICDLVYNNLGARSYILVYRWENETQVKYSI